MHRRNFIHNASFTAGGLMLAQKKLISLLFNQPAYNITMLRDNIGVFTEKGGTIAFLLSKSGIVVVDSQFPEQSTHLIEELKKQSTAPFLKLINTHHHGDHTAGNISFKGIVPHVLAHKNSKTNQENVAVKQKTEDKQLYPDQVYDTTWCEDVDKEKICLDYFGPGHTNGDSLVHFQHADIVHLGDLLFNRRYPFIDRSAGANIKNWITIMDKAQKKYSRKTIFVYGHALDPLKITGDKEDLKLFGDFLEKLLAFAESEFKAGKTKEEFMKNTAIPGNTEWKGDGIERPLQAAYEEVSA